MALTWQLDRKTSWSAEKSITTDISLNKTDAIMSFKPIFLVASTKIKIQHNTIQQTAQKNLSTRHIIQYKHL